MTPHEFIEKWKRVALNERQAAQGHFYDLCRLLDHPDPITADPSGEAFCFEKGAPKTGGGDGFADVWKRGHFAWEYKKKRRNLDDALKQLVQYASALENPPLLVACDTDRFKIVTAWTNTVSKSWEIGLDDLEDPDKLAILRAVFHDPEKLRPARTRQGLTREAADKFSTIAMQPPGHCAAGGHRPFRQPARLLLLRVGGAAVAGGLLSAPAEEGGAAAAAGQGLSRPVVRGDGAGRRVRPHRHRPLQWRPVRRPPRAGARCRRASTFWWRCPRSNGSRSIPTIFGTLFERFLDPDKRAQIGAHYTDPAKIMLIIEPVVLRPLQREWAQAKAARSRRWSRRPAWRALEAVAKAEERRFQFLERLRTLRILDPACGSGNFLYLALQHVKDLELRANRECEILGLAPQVTQVGPEILRGIEINPMAAELARTTIWIGDIQWGIRNGIYARPEPILRKLDAIECRDALVTWEPAGEDAVRHGRGQQARPLGRGRMAGRRFHRRQPAVPGRQADARASWARTPSGHFAIYEGRVRPRPTSSATGSRRRAAQSTRGGEACRLRRDQLDSRRREPRVLDDIKAKIALRRMVRRAVGDRRGIGARFNRLFRRTRCRDAAPQWRTCP